MFIRSSRGVTDAEFTFFAEHRAAVSGAAPAGTTRGMAVGIGGVPGEQFLCLGTTIIAVVLFAL